MNKKETYLRIIQQAKAIYDPELGQATNLAQVAALLKYELKIYWVGFYLRKNRELLLGPFQGEIACTRIAWGKGVCGTAAATGVTQIVDDVTQFPGYIACHPAPKSEIVVPGAKGGELLFVLDLDSTEVAFFDETDKLYLEELVAYVAGKMC
ncbi:MAG: GAF domain-containing protein [Bacteroidia bacterium]